MANTKYNYYAFICYAREDESMAQWLYNAIEYRNMPSLYFCNDKPDSGPMHLFMNKLEQSDGEISENIKQAMLSSRYLIVICTMHVVNSAWVNQKVKLFIEAGRLSDIIPVVYTGINDVHLPIETYMPVVLRNISELQSLDLIDLDQLGMEKGKIYVIARLMNMHPERLWKRMEHKKMVHYIIFAACAILLILFAGFWIDRQQAHYHYYANIAHNWIQPVGVGELTPEEVSHCSNMFRFEYHYPSLLEGLSFQRRLDCISYVNSQNQVNSEIPFIMTEEEQCPILKFDYRKGEIYSIDYCDVNGKMKYHHVLSEYQGKNAGLVARTWQHGQSGAPVMNMSDFIGTSTKVHIPYYLLERDSAGYVIGCSYHMNNDRNWRSCIARDVRETYGVSIERDARHLPVCYTYLDADLNPMSGRWDVGRIRRTFNDKGFCVRIDYETMDGKPAYVSNRGYASIITDRDQYGNCLSVHCYDVNGDLCMTRQGYAMIKNRYDDKGLLIEQAFYDEKEQPCYASEGAELIRFMYDEDGRCKEKIYYDSELRPVLNKQGYAMVKYKYNESGRWQELSIYGTEGLSCQNIEGFSRITYQYDERGNRIERRTYDLYDIPVCSLDSVLGPCVTWSYDERDLCVAVNSYDAEGKPFEGHHGVCEKMVYDRSGNELEHSFYDAHGELTTATDYGCAKLKFIYDVYGNMTSCSFYDKENLLMTVKEGIASIELEYDGLFHVSKISYKDASNNPCLNTQLGYASVAFDDNQMMKTVRYYGVDGNLCLTYERVAMMKVRYDKRLEPIEYTYYDCAEQPVENKNGVFRKILDYDKQGHIRRVSFFNVKNKPVIQLDKGYAVMEATYDAEGNCLSEYYYDAEKNLCTCKDGYAYWIATYEDMEKQYVTYYNVDGSVRSIL